VKDKKLVLEDDHQTLLQRKLTKKESEEMSAAFEMSLFTETYAERAKAPAAAITSASQGDAVSKSSSFLVDMGLKALEASRKKHNTHFVRLSRNLVTSLTTAFVKLKQDLENLVECQACQLDVKINYNDRKQLVALLEFIMRGSVESNDFRKDFDLFLKNNAAAISAKVDAA